MSARVGNQLELRKMAINKIVLGVCCALVLGMSGCSRQQSDWQKTRETNTTEAYEQFLKKYPSGEFAPQAQARVKELYEERDWQKARDADTPEAYQAFLKQYPEGKWTEEARIRVENFTLAQTPPGTGTAAPGTVPSGGTAPGGEENGTPPPRGGSTAQNPASPQAKSPSHAAGQAPKQKASAAVKSGSYGVQLGAFKSGAAAANRRWTRLQKEYPQLLAGMSSKVVPKKTASGTLFRLQAFGATERHARDICKSLKAKSQPCVVLRPTHA
jgi:cell division protein FtsN